jgi:hypothetical protein
MSHAVNGFGGVMFLAGARAVEDMVFALAVPGVAAPVAGNQAVRQVPMLQAIYATNPGVYPDYSEALAVNTELPHASPKTMDIITVRNGFLVVNTERLNIDNSKPAVISLFDCFGRLVGRWNVTAAQNHIIPLSRKFAHGAYIARITCGSAMMVRPVVIR